MTPSDSVHLAWSIIFYTAVILGLGALVACVAWKVADWAKERRQAAANGKRLGLYLEVEPDDEVAAAFRRQREAAAARRAAER